MDVAGCRDRQATRPAVTIAENGSRCHERAQIDRGSSRQKYPASGVKCTQNPSLAS